MTTPLADIATLPESAERTATLVEWIQDLFEEEPVLVGGGAVELYTGGAYTTGDLDFLGSVPAPVGAALRSHGFTRQGRHWVHEEHQIFLEFPGSSLPSGEEAVDLEIGGHRVRVVAPEALIVDRLAAWQFWGSEQDAVNALLVHRAVRVDGETLARLARDREVVPALERLRGAIRQWTETAPEPEEVEEWAKRIPAG